MKEIIFVTGGCRSGKSNHALAFAEQVKGKNKFFFATCIPHDDEMKYRVKRHQDERGSEWQTVETPLNLPEAINETNWKADVILVDCLTLWISNLLMENESMEAALSHVDQLVRSLEKASCRIILVSNEVGSGIVPENKLARLYRDIVGMANQRVAQCADRVIFTVSGIPVVIKGTNGEEESSTK